MDDWKKKNGISLVALTVTIIILLILTGVTLKITHNSIIDKVILASTKTAEEALQEKIKLILNEIEISYWMDASNNFAETKSEYWKRMLVEKLGEIEDIKNVQIWEGENEELKIAFSSENQNYEFKVLSDGEVNFKKPLKGNVKLGDYIEYPIEYIDVYSEKIYTALNGWRVIDDGVMEGTSGYVKIISTGVPAKWSCEGINNRLELDNLMNHFEELELQDNKGTEIEGKQFKNEKFASKITTISLSDLNQVCNILYETKRDLSDTSVIEDKYELFHLKNSGMFYYWLGTIREETKSGMYFISDEGIDYYDYDYNKARFGVRPVIYLKNGMNCKLENNVWKIID